MSSYPIRGAATTALLLACLLASAACQGQPQALASLPAKPRSPSARPPQGDALSGLGGVVLFNHEMRGAVRGLDGRPAAGAEVRVTPLPIGVVSHEGAALRALLQAEDAEGRATTDASGQFVLKVPDDRPFNLEASLGGELKAIRQSLRAADGAAFMQLAPVGGLAGRVTAPDAKGVTDLEGVDVFIPGTGYAAKTDASGAFTMAQLPAGEFVLVARKDGLGRASLGGVRVPPGGTGVAPELALRVDAPVITAMVPAIGAPGLEVELHGDGFGATSGAPFQLTMGGLVVARAERLDNRTLRVTLPANSASGDLALAVGGVAGPPIHAAIARTLVPLPGRDALLQHEQLPVRALALDADGRALGEVPAAFRASGDGAALEAGVLQAAGAGQAVVSCTFGGLDASVTLPVRPVIGEVSVVYDGAEVTPGDLALTPRGELVVVDAGSEGKRARLVALDAAGQVAPLAFDTGPEGPAPREVAVAADGTLHVLADDNSIWSAAPGGAPRRVYGRSDLEALLATLRPDGAAGGPTPPGGRVGPPSPGMGPPPGLPTAVARGLAVDAAGRLTFQPLPGLVVRVTPEQPATLLPITPPGVPSVAEALAVPGPAGLVVFLPRPGVTPVLIRMPAEGRGEPLELAGDPGTPGGMVLDGRGGVYLTSAAKGALYQLGERGELKMLVGTVTADATGAHQRGLEAPRGLVVDAEGTTVWVLDGERPTRIRRINLRR